MRIEESYETGPLDEATQVITGPWEKEIQYSIETDSEKWSNPSDQS